jgi:hypothetical protein
LYEIPSHDRRIPSFDREIYRSTSAGRPRHSASLQLFENAVDLILGNDPPVDGQQDIAVESIEVLIQRARGQDCRRGNATHSGCPDLPV